MKMLYVIPYMLHAANSGKPKARSRQIISVLMVLYFASLLITSCDTDPKHPGYEFMPDMYRSRAYNRNSENNLFSDSMTNRLPVAGTMPRGSFLPYPYPNTPEGYE